MLHRIGIIIYEIGKKPNAISFDEQVTREQRAYKIIKRKSIWLWITLKYLIFYRFVEL